MHKTEVSHAAQDELAEYKQWVNWEYDHEAKIPIVPATGRKADVTDPSTWDTFDEAIFAGGSDRRIGFVFTADDPFTGIDIDNCVDNGEILSWAWEIIEALASYAEISPSGTGVKIWIRAKKPGTRCTTGYETGKIEIYDSGRYFTFTGRQFGDWSTIEDRQAELNELYSRLFPDTENESSGIYTVVGDVTLEDEELLAKARKASSGKAFSKLYDEGDTSKYSHDQNRADEALCLSLAWWTNKNPEQMDRLFRGSALMRKKWDERRGNSTYGAITIDKAIKKCVGGYDLKYSSSNKVKDLLKDCRELELFGGWGHPTDRDVYKVLIDTAEKYGRVEKDGVRVAASTRDIAVEAGIANLPTVRRSLKRLEERGLIKRLAAGTKKKASIYLINLTHSEPINTCVNTYGSTLIQTRKIRNPSQAYGTIGKRNGQILDYVYALGIVVTDDELVKLTGARKNNLKGRNIKLLLELELLVEQDGGYIAPTDIHERLERELKDSGIAQAERLQRQKYEQERQAWKDGRKRYVKEQEHDPTNNMLMGAEKVREMLATLHRVNPEQATDTEQSTSKENENSC